VPASKSAVATEPRDDFGNLIRAKRLVVVLVDDDHGRAPAAAGALDRAQGHDPVVGRAARLDAELLRERIEDGLCPGQCARQVRAHLDDVLPDGLEIEHVVERGDRKAVRRRLVERVRHLTERVRR
jgi:hypothetical protein